jgi:AcrR family transcriptional regulator
VETESRRERKRLATHRALIRSARELVQAHGLDGVTVEEIADAAGYTARTFFNHFSCKEEAVVALDPATLSRLESDLRARPAEEGPAEALRAVLVGGADASAMRHHWQLRHELVTLHPKLLPRHLAATEQVESALTLALAERLGIDPTRDPRVRMLVAGVLATTRAAVNWWSESDGSRSLESILDDVLDLTNPISTSTP